MCVGNGNSDTKNKSKRFSRNNTESARSRYSVIVEWLDQAAPIEAKLTR